ncbi:MAG: cadherin repeat domain-containing protein, partial [Burkholderiales bacterium]|nr:cadherin repeat domain-containing protein [Burkholderiales bacterium]
AIVLNSGSINDRAGNVATITNTVGSANGSYMVDTAAATVSTVAIVGAAGLQGSLLNIGDVVTASVTFSEKVMVTGTPQLGLNIGDTVVQGNYLSGKGSNTLLFTYTVASGLTDANGVSINANALALNAGTITDVSGTAAVITHAAVLDNAAYAVENTEAPGAPAWTTNASGKNSLTTTLGNGLAADLPASLSLGTVSGVNLNLVSKVTLGNGKVYYLLDQNGDGLYDVRDKSLNHNSLDTLLNGGADTVDTQLRGAVAGVDDARTLVQGGYTLVLPTANEWNNFNDAVLGATFPVPGWSQEFYFTASKMGAELHNPAMLDSNVVHVAWGWNEDWAYTHNLAFEVLSNGSFKLDVTPRSFTSPTSVSVAENTATSTAAYTPVASDEGTLYYEISGSDASLFTVNSTTGAVVFKGRPDFENRLDANQDGVYSINIVTTDSVGTVVTSPVDITVTDVAETATAYTVGQAVIDLGGYGKLIAPVTVEGKTYYYWDRSGDGVARNGTGTENESVDYTDHQTLDRIFKYSSDFTTTNPAGFGADTTNTYRYATLNGVKLALPTYGGPVDANGKSASTTSRAGTAVADGTTENGTYDDLLAIWDAFNGSGTTTNASGIPSGWLGGDVFYQSATNASADSHQRINLNSGLTAPLSNTIDGYVVLQVLA